MFLQIKTPETYITENGIVARAGEYISAYGRKAFVISGKTAFAAIKEKFIGSLEKNGISADSVNIFSGYPSQSQFDSYAAKAKEAGADVIVGIGGGRVLDTAKAVGDILGLPVTAVPTVGATCAAWAAVTIQYDDIGRFVNFRNNAHSARLVLADPEVILRSPVRYLHSGVVDTFAKLYEIRPVNESHPENIPFDVALYASGIAFDRLVAKTISAEKDAEKGVFAGDAKDVVDSIIYLAGFAGSLKTELSQYSFAHPFYHSATRITGTHEKLHGEIVATGIIVQLLLEKKTQEELSRALELFRSFGDLFSLTDLGLGESQEELASSVSFLAKDIKTSFGTPWTEDEVSNALLSADGIIKDFRK
ncbi:MAG: iron-containing alcohol dehydrogenase family protein [Treponema sp.]|nr:iron-containing alcohol dehydrogenase family protein [Treponema sp.]MBQ7165372.1 iron-containing alcohol dehydrogenase family protein [Treponema sp.]